MTRGHRVARIREESGMDQRAFVDALNEKARALALPAVYDIVKLSKIENGKRDVSLDDAILVAELDPTQRGVKWIAGCLQVAPKRERRYGEPSKPRTPERKQKDA